MNFKIGYNINLSAISQYINSDVFPVVNIIKNNASRAYSIFKYSDVSTIFEDFEEEPNVSSYFSFESLIRSAFGNFEVYKWVNLNNNNSSENSSKNIVIKGKLLEAFLFGFNKELLEGEKPDFINIISFDENNNYKSIGINYEKFLEYYKTLREEELRSQIDSFTNGEIDNKALIKTDLLTAISVLVENQEKINNLFLNNTITVGSTNDLKESKVLDININELLNILRNENDYNSFFSENKRDNFNIYLHAFNVLYNDLKQKKYIFN